MPRAIVNGQLGLPVGAPQQDIMRQYGDMGGMDEMVRLYQERAMPGQSFEDFAFGSNPEQRFGASEYVPSAPTWDYAAQEASTITPDLAATYLKNLSETAKVDPALSKKERAQIISLAKSKGSNMERVQKLQQYFVAKMAELNQMEMA